MKDVLVIREHNWTHSENKGKWKYTCHVWRVIFS